MSDSREHIIGEIIATLTLLAVDNPRTSSTEGLDDGCFFCEEERMKDGVQLHKKDCPWVRARRLLDLPTEARPWG